MRVEPREVIIVEGILLLADARLRDLFDIRIFVDVGDDVRFIRRLLRDTAGAGTHDGQRDPAVSSRPCGRCTSSSSEPSKRYADVILPEGGFNRIGIEMIQARVERELARRRSEEAAEAIP